MWGNSLSGDGASLAEAGSHQHADSDRLPSVTRESSSTKEVFLQAITVGSDAFTDRATRARC